MNRPLPEGKRVGIVTGGGGLGVIAADACADEGLEVVKLSDETLASIGQYMPDYWVPGNPVDLVAGLDLRIIKPILEVMLHSGEIDALLFIFVEAQQSKGKDVRTEGAGRGYELGELWSKMAQQLGVSLQELYGVMREAGVPIYAVLNYSRIKRIKADPEPGGKYVMIFDEVEFACAAMSAMYRYHEYLQRTD
jgi:acyl-CoA synthetase (NDP forming)